MREKIKRSKRRAWATSLAWRLPSASVLTLLACHARRAVGIRMALLTTERQFWHCGARTAEPTIGNISPMPPIPYYQKLLLSVARGLFGGGS